MAVSWVLKPQHRSRVMFQRFMPWWNAQRRKELAEKKEAEKKKKEDEIRQQEKMLKEEQEKQAMVLEEQMRKESEETKEPDDNNGLVGKVVENKHQEEGILDDSRKIQVNKITTNEYHVGKDLKDNKIRLENINKVSIEKKNKDKINSKNPIEMKNIPSDNRRDVTPVHQVMTKQVCVKQDLNQIGIKGTTLNQDDQNVKRGKLCNVKNSIQHKNIKQNCNATKPESNKKNCLNDKCVKIENNKDVVKLNNFENNDIIKTHNGSQSKNKVITVND